MIIKIFFVVRLFCFFQFMHGMNEKYDASEIEMTCIGKKKKIEIKGIHAFFLKEKLGGMTPIIISNNGRWAAYLHDNKAIAIYNMRKKKLSRMINIGGYQCEKIKFSLSSNILGIYCSGDVGYKKHILLWNIHSGYLWHNLYFDSRCIENDKISNSINSIVDFTINLKNKMVYGALSHFDVNNGLVKWDISEKNIFIEPINFDNRIKNKDGCYLVYPIFYKNQMARTTHSKRPLEFIDLKADKVNVYEKCLNKKGYNNIAEIDRLYFYEKGKKLIIVYFCGRIEVIDIDKKIKEKSYSGIENLTAEMFHGLLFKEIVISYNKKKELVLNVLDRTSLMQYNLNKEEINVFDFTKPIKNDMYIASCLQNDCIRKSSSLLQIPKVVRIMEYVNN